MLPRTLPPTYQLDIPDRDAALIAGFLMRHREGTILASDTTAYMQQVGGEVTGDFGAMYYRHAEAYSRFLLWKLGYAVEKDSTAWDFVTGRSRDSG